VSEIVRKALSSLAWLRAFDRAICFCAKSLVRPIASDSTKDTQRRNGFVSRSWPIVVGGPWPESTVTPSLRGNNFFLMLAILENSVLAY